MSTPPQCHPECHWACDEPVCFAECMIVTEPPQCTCANPLIIPICRVDCTTDQCEMEQCPACETICTSPDSSCGDIQCEQTQASWACRKPSSCPQPTCELMCEKPACEYQGLEDPWIKKNEFSWVLLIAGLVVVFLLGLNVKN